MLESHIVFPILNRHLRLIQNIMFMFDTLLGSKKISVIACGQTSSMALSDAGEVGVKKDETRKFLTFIY